MGEEAKGARTAGGLLRAAREKHGLHIAALAAAMKVAPRKLDALENDRWSELPDATFVRALALTVCRTLKVDAKPVLDLLPPAQTMALQSIGEHLNAPYHDTDGRRASSVAGGAIRPMVWAAAALMVAALAVYFVPEARLKGAAPNAVTAVAAVAVVAPAAPASVAAAAAPALPGSAAVGLSDSALPLPAASAAAVMPSAGETVFSAPSISSLQSTAAVGVVQLRTSEASWVDVRDGRGQVLLSRIVQPGELVGLDGAPPMRLTIGNAAATQLSFRGQPVNLAPNTRDNVARVELQ
jgi:cytoskeleton protein RodZ